MIKDIEIAMVFAGARSEMPLIYSLIGNLPLPVIGRPSDIFSRITKYGEVAVENTKAASKGRVKTLFSKMYPEDGAEQPFPDWLIAQESANIIIAGSDTTAMTLTFLVYAVLQNPDVKYKLLAEIATCSERPGWDELEGKQYLNNVIQESLRLHPPVPATLPRTTPEEGSVLAGFRIPGGTTVGTQAHTFHRDQTAFPNPER